MSTLVQRSVLGSSGYPLDQIHIAGIAARGFHGVLESERIAGQDFSADVTLYLDTRAAASGDDLEATVNYALVAQDVADILSGEPVNLIETVAEQIAAAVLARPAVISVDVTIHKPQAPIPVPFADVVVTIHRDRVNVPVVASPLVAAPEVALGAAAALPAGIDLPDEAPAVEDPEVAELLETADAVTAEDVDAAEQSPVQESVYQEPVPTTTSFPLVISRQAEIADDELGTPVDGPLDETVATPLDAPLDEAATTPLDAPLDAPLNAPHDTWGAPVPAFPSEPPVDLAAAAVAGVAGLAGSAGVPTESAAEPPVIRPVFAPAPAPTSAVIEPQPEITEPEPEPALVEPAPVTSAFGVAATAVLPPLDEQVLAEQARLSEQARRPEVFGMADIAAGRAPDLLIDATPVSPTAQARAFDAGAPESEVVVDDLAPVFLHELDAAHEQDAAREVAEALALPAEEAQAPEALIEEPESEALSQEPSDAAHSVDETTVILHTFDRMDNPPTEPIEAVLALGANLGDAQETLRRAVAELGAVSGVTITSVGPLARTAAVGGPEQPDFLNTVVLVTTTLSPRDLLHASQSIEADHGRERLEHWGPRTLDIDVIAYGALVHSSDDLEVPHPRANERAFVLAPWAHIAPDAVLPGLGGGPVGALAATAPDRDGIRWLALDWLQESESPAQPASFAPQTAALPDASGGSPAVTAPPV